MHHHMTPPASFSHANLLVVLQVVSPTEEHGPSTHALALQHASASLLLGPSGEVLPHSMPSAPSSGYPTFKFGPSEEVSRRRSRGSPENSPGAQEGSLSPVRRSSQVQHAGAWCCESAQQNGLCYCRTVALDSAALVASHLGA